MGVDRKLDNMEMDSLKGSCGRIVAVKFSVNETLRSLGGVNGMDKTVGPDWVPVKG